jgi:hypothetical protein
MTIFKTFSSVLIAWSMCPNQKFVLLGVGKASKKVFLLILKMISRRILSLTERR